MALQTNTERDRTAMRRHRGEFIIYFALVVSVAANCLQYFQFGAIPLTVPTSVGGARLLAGSIVVALAALIAWWSYLSKRKAEINLQLAMSRQDARKVEADLRNSHW